MHVKLGLIQQAPSPPGALQQQHRTISLPQTAEKGTDYFPDNGLASLQGAKLVMVGYTNSAYLVSSARNAHCVALTMCGMGGRKP